MNIVKRAFQGIVGRPFQNLLLLLIIYALGSAIFGAFTVNQASSNLELSVKNRLGARVSIESLDKNSRNSYDFTSEELTKHRNDFKEIVNFMDRTLTHPDLLEIDYALVGLVNRQDSFVNVDVRSQGVISSDCNIEYPCNSMEVFGISNSKFLDFGFEGYSISDGRMLSQDEIDDGIPNVVLSYNEYYYYQTEKKLELGDFVTISIKLKPYTFPGVVIDAPVEEYSFDVKVVGFMSGEDSFSEPSLLMSSKLFMKHKLATDAKTEELVAKYQTNYLNPVPFVYNNTFYLKNIDTLKAFSSDVRSGLDSLVGVTTKYQVLSSAEEFNSLIGPVSNIERITSIAVYGTIISSLVIVGLILIQFIRGRKHEVGIYLSLGEGHLKIISQIFLEVLAIAVIALVLATATSDTVSGKLSQSMINNQIVTIDKEGLDPLELNEKEAILKEYSIGLNINSYLTLYVSTLGIISMALIPTTIYIFKANPKKILMG